MTNVPVTDADRELLTRMMTGRPHTEHDWPVVWEQDALQAIALARAEEREACAVECDRAAALIRTAGGMVVGNSVAAEIKRETRATVAVALDQVAANIRARGEGGKA